VAALRPVLDPSDPLLADFVALNDPVRRRALERSGDHFVVEGILAIERLLDLPQWSIRSLALTARVADRLAARLATIEAPVAVCDEDVLREVVGFDLHRGALASVQRRSPHPASDASLRPGDVLVAAEGLNDHENLGGLYRNAAGFGAAAVALDPTCADPFYRRSVRVSLGHVLAVPTLRLPGGAALVEVLRAMGATTVALTPAGDRPLRTLDRTTLGPGPVAVVVGAEGPGLTDAVLAAADHRVAIEMAPGVDSLNVATATAIALHHLQR
jgi:tRNA G18 (ribose-2'-O)-methylase SpoU